MEESARQESFLKAIIEKEVFIRGSEHFFYPPGKWLFDFRRVLLRGDVSNAVAEVLWERFKKYDRIQIGGLESAAIPIVAACIVKFQQYGKTINGFYIRKSRKKKGLLAQIEGALEKDVPVILVDDLINTGSSFQKQVEILKEEGFSVKKIFVLLRFRELSFYRYFHDRGIPVEALFTLEDFRESLGTNFLKETKKPVTPQPFRVLWRFQSHDPDLQVVLPKGGVAFDNQKIYFGSDQGTLWAIDKKNGSVVWYYQVARLPKRKGIFSTPIVYKQRVYFGATDGNVYCVNALTGEKIFVSFAADRIQGDLRLVENEQALLVPATFGLWKKKGGIVAISPETGKALWETETGGEVTGEAAYSKKRGLVFVGDDRGNISGLRLENGQKKIGISLRASIAGALVLDPTEQILVVQTLAGHIHALDVVKKRNLWTAEAEAGFFGAPLIWDGKVYSASLDKKLYCHDLASGEKKWTFETGGRIFSSPTLANDRLYVGSNDGKLYELEPKTGQATGELQLTERITHAIAYDQENNLFFIPTQANEVYCVKREEQG